MTDYQISQRATGHILGQYTADSIDEALTYYARDCGYRSYADLAETIGKTEADARAELCVDVIE